MPDHRGGAPPPPQQYPPPPQQLQQSASGQGMQQQPQDHELQQLRQARDNAVARFHRAPRPFDTYPGARWERASTGAWVELLQGDPNQGVIWCENLDLSQRMRRDRNRRNDWQEDGTVPPELVEQRRAAAAGFNARNNYEALRRSFADSPKKNYGGLGGDSAAINWALAATAMVSAAVVAGFSYQFLQAFAENDGAGPQDFKYPYYACQFLFGLSIVTSVLLALYVIWVFFDSAYIPASWSQGTMRQVLTTLTRQCLAVYPR
jgi:hypothetical protein